MISERQKKQLTELLSDAAASPRLTKWEENFVSDMQQRLDAYGAGVLISDKQQEILDRIEAKVYAS